MGIKRGQLVEFTMSHYRSYPPADTSLVLYGVAVEDEQANVNGSLRVRMADGSERLAPYIHASAWAGWVPDGLEPILEALIPYSNDWDDDY